MTTQTLDVVVTGTAWLGGGIGAIETALSDMFSQSRNEVLITAFSITNPDDRIFSLLQATLNRGVQVKLVVNRLNAQIAPVYFGLTELARRYAHLHLYDYESADPDADLHAKVICCDRDVAIVGSSNLSRRGMITNQELAVVVRGSAAQKVATAIDRLLIDRYCFRSQFE